MSLDKLGVDDADQIADAADRAVRMAATARHTAVTDPEAAPVLADLAAKAEGLAEAAETVIRWIEEHRQ